MKSGRSGQEEREAHLRVWILDLRKSSVCCFLGWSFRERERERDEIKRDALAVLKWKRGKWDFNNGRRSVFYYEILF